MDTGFPKSIVLKGTDYNRFVDLIYRSSGINLGDNKQELLKTRFLKIMRKLGLDSYRAYYDHVTGDMTGAAFSEMIDAISTNHTFFFREKEHFAILQRHLGDRFLRARRPGGSRKLRVWCAASSSGEEPYTIIISILEILDPMEWDIKVLATDISTKVLRKALDARYKKSQLKEMSPALVERYFDRDDEDGEKYYRVKPEIQQFVTFRQFNLMSERFPFKNKFDVIFCRNVMIYFDTPTQQTLIEKLLLHLDSNGLFFIGHSETVPNALRARLKPMGPAVFQKP